MAVPPLSCCRKCFDTWLYPEPNRKSRIAKIKCPRFEASLLRESEPSNSPLGQYTSVQVTLSYRCVQRQSRILGLIVPNVCSHLLKAALLVFDSQFLNFFQMPPSPFSRHKHADRE